MSMNSMEVEMAAQGCAEHPVLGPATRFLKILVEHTNENSDGWHSWDVPSRASQALQQLIHDNTGGWGDPQTGARVTLAEVEKALVPIRRMAAIQSKKQWEKYGNKYEFNCDEAWREACGG